MPPARKREPIVPQKVKTAVDYMFATPGATLQTAANHVGMETRKLRFAMTQPHVLRWMLQEKQARLEAASAGNIGALLSVRDYGDNAMAKVHAAKTIEAMLDVTSERTGIRPAVQQRQPGLQIVIAQSSGERQVVCGSPPMPMLDVTRTPEVEPVRHVRVDPKRTRGNSSGFYAGRTAAKEEARCGFQKCSQCHKITISLRPISKNGAIPTIETICTSIGSPISSAFQLVPTTCAAKRMATRRRAIWPMSSLWVDFGLDLNRHGTGLSQRLLHNASPTKTSFLYLGIGPT
jgi:hypothetical protein